MDHIIREYTNEDVASIRKCLIELQEFERLLDPDRLEGIEIAHEYLEQLLRISRQEEGKVFVVEIDGDIVGMISILIEDNIKHYRKSRKVAFISDVMILPEFKDKGILKELVKKAEDYARSIGIRVIQTAMLSKHDEGIEGFQRNGFSNYEIILQKKLS